MPEPFDWGEMPERRSTARAREGSGDYRGWSRTLVKKSLQLMVFVEETAIMW
jgi:hypothetical protein